MSKLLRWEEYLQKKGNIKKTIKLPLSAITVAIISITVIAFCIYLQNTKYYDHRYLKLFHRCKTCTIAQKAAIEDFNERKYQLIIWGLTSSNSPTIKMAEILKSDYNIITYHYGCISIEELECYDNEMRIQLQKKFGKNFFKNAYEKARQKLTQVKTYFVYKHSSH